MSETERPLATRPWCKVSVTVGSATLPTGKLWYYFKPASECPVESTPSKAQRRLEDQADIADAVIKTLCEIATLKYLDILRLRGLLHVSHPDRQSAADNAFQVAKHIIGTLSSYEEFAGLTFNAKPIRVDAISSMVSRGFFRSGAENGLWCAPQQEIEETFRDPIWKYATAWAVSQLPPASTHAPDDSMEACRESRDELLSRLRHVASSYVLPGQEDDPNFWSRLRSTFPLDPELGVSDEE